MRRIILVGSGNVATHLGIALKKSNYNVIQVYSRSIKGAKELAQKLDSNFTNIPSGSLSLTIMANALRIGAESIND